MLNKKYVNVECQSNHRPRELGSAGRHDVSVKLHFKGLTTSHVADEVAQGAEKYAPVDACQGI